MGWFKKKKEAEEAPQLPELPEPSDDLVLPSAEDLPKIPGGLPEVKTSETEIPSIPELPKQEQKEIIKKPPEIQEMQKSQFDIEQPAKIEPTLQKPAILKKPATKPEFQGAVELPEIAKPTKKIKPIYVRLDKFETTVESFEEMKNKIMQIEQLLMRTREIKSKEEQELEAWEGEIKIIKARIEDIDKNIFDKFD